MKFNWFVGIDISKLTLDACLYNQDQKKSEYIQISNDNKGFKLLSSWLKKKKCKLNEILFCIEHTGIYGLDLCSFFEENTMFYSALPAIEIKRSIGLKRGKNDKVDAFHIARYAMLHAAEIKLSKLPSKSLNALKQLLNERERLVKTRTIEKQTFKELKKLSTKASEDRMSKRLVVLNQQIAEIEQEMEELIESEDSFKQNFELINGITGIGLITSVVFLIYTNNFESFTDGRKFACYGGVAPFENSSGTSIKGKTKVSHFANKRIKTCLTMAARSAVINDSELKIYYKRKSDEGKVHGVIMNAVKFKLILRVFAVIKRGTPFVKMRQAG